MTVPSARRPVSLIWYLIGFIALIVGIVVASSLAVSYFAAGSTVRHDFSILMDTTGNNAIESAWMVNTGLLLVDEDLNPLLEAALADMANAYVSGGNDPHQMDLAALKEKIDPGIPGSVDLYVFDAEGIIQHSTLPDMVGIDFRNYPDFYRELTRIRLGSEFAADPVVRSVGDPADLTVNGTLRKFAYLPSPDHAYVFEIGVESQEFTDDRSRLSYQAMAERLLSVNSDLAGIRVRDFYNNIAGTAGTLPDDDRTYAQKAMQDRAGFTVTDAANHTATRYIFVDLRDPRAASDTSVVIELCFSTARLDLALAELVIQYAFIGAIAVFAGIVLAFALFRRLTGAIREIVDDVAVIASGDLGHAIRSVDTAEFAELESGITTMIARIVSYTEELERKKAELQVAAEIQQAFLPRILPRIPGFDLAAASIPAREVGGDFYDIFPAAGGNYALVIADVAGKGVPASLFMALTRTAIRIVSRREHSAHRVLDRSNTIFIEDAGSPSFVTVFFALIDKETRTLTFVNAGHNPPLICHDSGNFDDLGPTGPVIGLVDNPEYGEENIHLAPGDVLVMYTDGITEAINNSEAMFGEERLKDVIRQSAGLPADGIVAAIRDAVISYCGEAPQYDDMTIVVVKVL